MYRATRKLIKERSRFCSRFTPKLVKMHWVEIGEAQRCFSNSLSAKVKDVNKSGSSENEIISVGLYMPITNHTTPRKLFNIGGTLIQSSKYILTQRLLMQALEHAA